MSISSARSVSAIGCNLNVLNKNGLFSNHRYQTDSDALGAFLAEACEVAPAAQVGAQALYDHYREWAVRHGLSDKERLGAVAFGRKASERFTRSHTMAGKVYLGVARAR